MAFGLGTLRLSSGEFWRMTPREIAAAIRALRGDAPAALTRTALDDLMKRFPDG